MLAAGVPTARHWACTTGAARARRSTSSAARRRQGGRARGRQGRRRCARTRRGALAAIEASLVDGAFGAAGATVVIEERLVARRSRCSRSATARRSRRSPPRRTQSGSATETGPEHRRHGRVLAGSRARRRGGREAVRFVHVPVLRRARPPRHAFQRLPVRRSDADRRRAARAGVQRALRRPRDAGARAAARRRPRRGARGGAGRAGDAELGIGATPRSTSCWPRRAIRRRREPGSRSPASSAARRLAGVTVFHAGTALRDGRWSAGGRVLGVTATAPTLAARARARLRGRGRNNIRRRADAQRHRAARGRGGGPCLSPSPTPTPGRRWVS